MSTDKERRDVTIEVPIVVAERRWVQTQGRRGHPMNFEQAEALVTRIESLEKKLGSLHAAYVQIAKERGLTQEDADKPIEKQYRRALRIVAHRIVR